MVSPNVLVPLFMALCPGTDVINKTDVWTDQDRQAIQQAHKRCPELYKDAPCLVLFQKSEEGAYQAVCGSKRDNLDK